LQPEGRRFDPGWLHQHQLFAQRVMSHAPRAFAAGVRIVHGMRDQAIPCVFFKNSAICFDV
jgi:hypothetical protein